MRVHSKYLLVCLLGGCLDAADPGQELEADKGAAVDDSTELDEPITNETEQAVANSHFDQRRFGGNIVATPFPPYVTQQSDPMGDCTPGFVRPLRPNVQWTSTAGGWCQFSGWNTGDAHDCRAVIIGGTGGGWFGGTCTSTIQEVPETFSPVGVFNYNASSTNSATVNTTNLGISLNPGQTVTISVCGENGSFFSGDPYIRLHDVWGNQASADDDTCGRGARVVYTATSGGSFQIAAGCWSNGACNGRVSWSIQ